eukprot:3899164-Pyramimonas_sp.AAC.1
MLAHCAGRLLSGPLLYFRPGLGGIRQYWRSSCVTYVDGLVGEAACLRNMYIDSVASCAVVGCDEAPRNSVLECGISYTGRGRLFFHNLRFCGGGANI